MQSLLVNTFIPADIRSSQYQALLDIALKQDVHQACEDLNPTSVYVRKEYCLKQFHIDFVEYTGPRKGRHYVT